MRSHPGLRTRRWAPGAAAALAALAVLAGSLAAAAPAGAASRAGRVVSLSGVSCHGSSWCMGVGTYRLSTGPAHALAQVWNGHGWRILANPPGSALTSVSCSSTTFCMARGGPTGTERWNGRSWTKMSSPAHAATAPSCGSRTLCMVLNGTGEHGSGPVAESWNGRKWRSWLEDTSACGGPPGFECGMADVACGSATNCVVVGTITVSQEPVQETASDFWNGRKWLGTDAPADGDPAALNAVSCAGSFCMAVGGAYQETAGGSVAVADVFDATTNTWTDASPDLGVTCTGLEECGWTGDISCGSATSCLAFGPHLAWNGSTWNSAPTRSAGHGSALHADSCGGQICMAVGYRTVAGVRRTLAELWNGTSWRILATPSRV